MSDPTLLPARPNLPRTASALSNQLPVPAPPVTAPSLRVKQQAEGLLELFDGSAFRGICFGAEGKSVAGECVFQTGMLPASCQDTPFTRKNRDGWLYRVFD